MFKAWHETTNSVNDDAYESTKYFLTRKEAEAFIQKAQDSVDEWNKPEPGGGYGGKMSSRWLSSEIEELGDDTVISGLTFGDFRSLVSQIIHSELISINTMP